MTLRVIVGLVDRLMCVQIRSIKLHEAARKNFHNVLRYHLRNNRIYMNARRIQQGHTRKFGISEQQWKFGAAENQPFDRVLLL